MTDKQLPAPQAPFEFAQSDRVPMGQKVAYGLGTINETWGNWLYPAMVWPVFNVYLLVSPGLVSTALMVNRLMDALAAPLTGWASDNLRSRWGRRRPFILVGSILAGVGLPLLFCVPLGWSELAYFRYMLLSSALFSVLVSTFAVPYESLGNELTPDYHERTRLFSLKNGITKLPEVAIFLASAFITHSVFNNPGTGKPNILRGAQVYAVTLGVIVMFVGVMVARIVREPYYKKIVSRQKTSSTLGDSIWKTLRCRPFRLQLAMSLAYVMGTSMVGTLGYYATVYYVCKGDVALGSKWNFGMGLSNMLFGILGVLVFASQSSRHGKKRAMALVLLTAVPVFVSTWWLYNPDVPWLQLGASGLIAFVSSGFWMLFGSIGADIIDFDELESGRRREGAFQACQTWILRTGVALSIGISGYILDATGFDAHLGRLQSTEALLLIRILLAGLPVLGFLVALLALTRFEISEARMVQIRKQLEERRGRV